MPRLRLSTVLLLLVFIMLVVSSLFGVLTYWLDVQALPTAAPGAEGDAPRGGLPGGTGCVGGVAQGPRPISKTLLHGGGIGQETLT